MPDTFSTQRLEELLAAATPGPWEVGRTELGYAIRSERVKHMRVTGSSQNLNLTAYLVTHAPEIVRQFKAADAADKWNAAQISRLRAALKALSGTLRGCIDLEEASLRSLLSNTNVNVLEHWLAEAAAALEAEPPGPPGGGEVLSPSAAPGEGQVPRAE